MWVTLHAILLLAIPLATVGGLLLLPGRRATLPALFVAVLVLYLAMSIIPRVHACGEGGAHTQLLLSGACLVPWLVLIKPRLARFGGGGLLLLAMFGLSEHFTDVVHLTGWTGNTSWRPEEKRSRAVVESLSVSGDRIAVESGCSEEVFPPCWLRELPMAGVIQEYTGPFSPRRRECRTAWHTWLTGLYPYELVPQDLWYPGGPLGEGLRAVELRDRRE